jgi:ureidoacrylate peracid hydrolase
MGLQKELCSPTGLLYDNVRDQLNERQTLSRTVEFIHQALDRDLRVFHVPMVFTPDYRELRAQGGVLGEIRKKGAFQAGTAGVAAIDELEPFADKIITVEPRRGLCAFFHTDLEEQLRRENVTTLAFGGLLTSICVESTARSAYELGFRIVILSDCTATSSAEDQRASEQYVFPMIGEVMLSSDWLESLNSPSTQLHV